MRLAPFDHRSIEAATAHRPWPLPDRPWRMTQTWSDLLFAHWPVEPGALAGRIPPWLTLDTFDGAAWLGVVPFTMSNVAPRGAGALGAFPAFLELNVRTYVSHGGRAGVLFFGLDASSWLAVLAARAALALPYVRARMRTAVRDGWVEARSERRGGGPALEARYRPVGAPAAAAPGSLEHFLTERYCLYGRDRLRRPYRLEIHHLPWPLQPAEARIGRSTMHRVAGLEAVAGPPRLHFARRLDVLTWTPDPLRSGWPRRAAGVYRSPPWRRSS